MSGTTLAPGGWQAILPGLGRIAARQELILVAIIIMTMLMMVLPMPTIMADALIAIDIGMALVLVLLSLYVRAATELSTLPSLILITTAFRLSISITTSRLVLVQGDAGAIIRTFGEFVIAGNVVVGLVVYLIITVVQFVVITKGSERVAEVAARFNLDALPGKQMSIDTDVRNGDLTQSEARRRRGMLERESHLYGAMDGAMKFVKGDAIASLVIIAVNLIGGIAIGCLQRGLPFSKAVQTYSLLAVGDGLIAQVPALLVSLTAGLVVTRAAAEEGGNLGENIVSQVVAHARPMQIAGVVLAGFGLVPGFPILLFGALGTTLCIGGFMMSRLHQQKAAKAFEAAAEKAERAPEPARLSIHVGLGFQPRLQPIKLSLVRLHAALESELGITLPKPRLETDPAFEASALQIKLDGVVRLSIDQASEEDMVGHVRRVVTRCAGEFVGIQETQAIVSRLEADYGDLVREAMKVAPLPRLAEILRTLVAEQIPVTNMRSILEAIASCGSRELPASGVADHVRVALKRQLCLRWSDATRMLGLLVLESAFEDVIREGTTPPSADPLSKLDKAATEAFLETVRRYQTQLGSDETGQPVLLASADIRRSLQAALASRAIDVPVLCYAELAPEFNTRVLGTIGRSATDTNVSQFPTGRPRVAISPAAVKVTREGSAA